MESPGFFQWTSRDLKGAKLPSKPFAAWLHFDREWRVSDAAALQYLIRGGARYLMITGVRHEDIHETVDEIAISETNDLVLTTSAEFNESAAFDFMSIRCPGRPCSARVLWAISEDQTSELERVTLMKRLVEANWD